MSISENIALDNLMKSVNKQLYVCTMTTHEKQALLHAGQIADLSLSIVGGQGLNGRVIPASIDDFSAIIEKLNQELRLFYFAYYQVSNLPRDHKTEILRKFAHKMAASARCFCEESFYLKDVSSHAKTLRRSVELYNELIFQLNTES